jgi:hypothetical protein
MLARPGFAGAKKFQWFHVVFFGFRRGKIGSPPPIEGIGGGLPAREPISSVHRDHGGRGVDGDRR